MRSDEFIKNLRCACSQKTIYCKGGFGIRLTASGKKHLIDQYEYNRKRADKINAMSTDSYAFDCSGLVKAALWGFNASKLQYGGAKYASNGCPDVNESGLLALCNEVSSDFGDNITPGEFLYMKGHCGIYIGNGEVAESTPIWDDGAQITRLMQRKWEKHGKLKFIEYGEKTDIQKVSVPSALPYLKFGSKGMRVQMLQHCLNAVGNVLEEDGIFGQHTKEALMKFQKLNHLEVDGVYGPETKVCMEGYFNAD